MLPLSSPTLQWLNRAAADPFGRVRDVLPEYLDFTGCAPVFQALYRNAPEGVEVGFPMVLVNGQLELVQELTAQARYLPELGGGRFIGTFHVHPAAGGASPFFDPADLATALRSDNAGFVDLLLAGGVLCALVRANPTLYISSHHVNRNPMLLKETHAGLMKQRGIRHSQDAGYADAYRSASLYFFAQYDLALYEGPAEQPLKRTVTPPRRR